MPSVWAVHFTTGHYARLVRGAAGVELHKARDVAKDQSYFLHAVAARAARARLMPLGEFDKGAVRERAFRSAGLPVFDKPDSTGICFIGAAAMFRRFFSPASSPPTPGPTSKLREGERPRAGTAGSLFYTLGQRAGLADRRPPRP